MSGKKPPKPPHAREELSLAWRGMRQYRPDLDVLALRSDDEEDGGEVDKAAAEEAKRYARVGTLDLSHNRLRGTCAFLSAFPALETLVLDDNRFTSSTMFPHHAALRTLSMNNNRIASLPAIVAAVRTAFPNLAHLSLLGNEACPNYLTGGTAREYAAYREYVTAALPTLVTLDDSPVRDAEREGGRHVYGAMLRCGSAAGRSAEEAEKNVRSTSAMRPPPMPSAKRGTRHTHRNRRAAAASDSTEDAEAEHAAQKQSDSDWTSGDEM